MRFGLGKSASARAPEASTAEAARVQRLKAGSPSRS